MRKKISSLNNPFIKNLLLLQKKSKLRKSQEEFVIEGLQEISYAQKATYEFSQVLVCLDLFDNALDLEKFDCEITEISLDVFEKLAYRSSTGGLIAIAKPKDLRIENLRLSSKTPLIMIAEAPEKPGNIGALLRTADAAKLDAVIIANPKTDLYNPNIIRSSVGTVFTNSIGTGTTSEIIDFLKNNNIKIYAAALQDSSSYLAEGFKEATAIVVGTEHQGLSEEWRINADKIIKIPMEGQVDSLNVSVSAAILIFEAKRQRQLS
ncbi:rRNA methylase SpoU-like protein [Psychroflexus torquis ATCC 700755]|uniref:rRNA methylase SpoU-like protein n=1 Tax=Psychroflexus torquis (strain ATCC 700755 / CIP 106069 / ACAM 623) TaxID=313595 RepID=K4IHS4_PSYTT|nr:RNA methyltransferase [Psychroflexus torquis]AFU69909.1 rRNA methylase SpoU-like protein [Psychroflexus torquis ATCC 700755]